MASGIEKVVKDEINGITLVLNGYSEDQKGRAHFSMFIWNNETYHVGDSILVAGHKDFHVARIEDVYDSELRTKDERYRLRVTWYEKWKSLKQKEKTILLKSLAEHFPHVHEDEIFVEGIQYKNDVPIDVIFRRCKVLHISPEASIEDALNSSIDEDGEPVFVARFVRTEKSLRPLMGHEKKDEKHKPGKQKQKKNVPEPLVPQVIVDLPLFETSLRPFMKKNFVVYKEAMEAIFDSQRRAAETAPDPVFMKDGRSCTFAGAKYFIGDFVFISNGEADVPEDELDNVFCAVIDEMNPKDKTLSVTYFARRDDLLETLDTESIPVDPPFLSVYEVAVDPGTKGEVVPGGSLVGKFLLAKALPWQNPQLVLSELELDSLPVLITRFAFAEKKLIPLPKKAPAAAPTAPVMDQALEPRSDRNPEEAEQSMKRKRSAPKNSRSREPSAEKQPAAAKRASVQLEHLPRSKIAAVVPAESEDEWIIDAAEENIPLETLKNKPPSGVSIRVRRVSKSEKKDNPGSSRTAEKRKSDDAKKAKKIIPGKKLRDNELSMLMDSSDSEDEGSRLETVHEDEEFVPTCPLSPRNEIAEKPARSTRRGSRVSIAAPETTKLGKENTPSTSGLNSPAKTRPGRKGRTNSITMDSGVTPQKKPRLPGKEPAVAPVTPVSALRRVVDLVGDDFARTPTVDTLAAREPTSASAKVKVKDLFGSINLPGRDSPLLKPETPLLRARASLHASAVPQSLPCREQEFAEIYSFAETHVQNGTGGCMYISGVPGTGKTATVQEVVKNLQWGKEAGELPDFKYIELNGMRLSNPERIYTELWCGITNGKERLAPANACEKLKEFVAANPSLAKHKSTARKNSKKGRGRGGGRARAAPKREGETSFLILIDELDLLWTRKQKVLYNLFDWPNQPGSRLVVLAVANTMDLPERILMNRVKSRLGMTRLVFHAYEFPQLQTIIHSRLEDLDCFEADAIQLVARKVASVSGDARRALNICQKAAEAAERTFAESEAKAKQAPAGAGTPRKGGRRGSLPPISAKVTMSLVNQVIQETFSEPAVLAVKACSIAEQHFLRALVSEFERTGVQEAKFLEVYHSYKTLCVFDDMKCAGPREVLRICENLAASGLVMCEGAGSMGIHQRVVLNTSPDSIHFALNDNRDESEFLP